MAHDAPSDDHVAEDSGSVNEMPEAPAFISPQDFYREIVQRKDVCRLLEALTT